jgi:iron(III) transport system ATP-binding protein
VDARGDRALVRLGTFALDLPRRGAATGAIKLAIRPEAITLCAAKPDGLAFAGRIIRMSYGGSKFEYTVETTLGELFIIDQAKRQPLARGATVWISFVEHGVSIVPTW